MDINEIDQFMTALGCDPAQHDDWVRAACPLAPFLHKSGIDSNPSFGMTPDIGGARYHCFSCTSGSASSLLDTLGMYLKNAPEKGKRYDLVTARAILDNGSLNVTKLKDYEDRSAHKEFYEWSSWVLDDFPTAITAPRAMHYLTTPKNKFAFNQQVGRGMTMKEVVDWDFRYDPTRDMVVIPFYDQYGRFAGMRGRSIAVKNFHDYTFNNYNNTELTWCNETCFQNDETVVVVEGQFDMVQVHKVYENVVANLTARITERKLMKLAECSAVVFMLDNDDTGYRAREKAVEFLTKKGVRVGYCTYSTHDPDQLAVEGIKQALLPFIPESKFKKISS